MNKPVYPKCTVPTSEVARIKGLGFLRDKTTEDKFNCRVLTVNGRVSSDFMRDVADAADKFGSGKLAMTSRMTIEIQGIPYSNVDDFIAFINSKGIECGGTGPKVRPVVSCKGTTCQYGLIDTFSLSKKIHKNFYIGYHNVKLPHKFKIAVGGCPNNCVKPDINDVGVIGQRKPMVSDKCIGCGLCVGFTCTTTLGTSGLTLKALCTGVVSYVILFNNDALLIKHIAVRKINKVTSLNTVITRVSSKAIPNTVNCARIQFIVFLFNFFIF